jgi:hypothetical protein
MVNATEDAFAGLTQNPPPGALKNNDVKSHHFKHIGFRLIITSADESVLSIFDTFDKYAKSIIGTRVMSILGSFLKTP